MIKELIDKLYSIQTIDDIHSIVNGNRLLENREEELIDFCESLQDKFAKYRAEAKWKNKAGRQEGTSQIEEDEHVDSGSEDEMVINKVMRNTETGEVEEIDVQAPPEGDRTSIIWRIHMQYVIKRQKLL